MGAQVSRAQSERSRTNEDIWTTPSRELAVTCGRVLGSDTGWGS